MLIKHSTVNSYKKITLGKQPKVCNTLLMGSIRIKNRLALSPAYLYIDTSLLESWAIYMNIGSCNNRLFSGQKWWYVFRLTFNRRCWQFLGKLSDGINKTRGVYESIHLQLLFIMMLGIISPQESGVNTLTSSQICEGFFNKGEKMKKRCRNCIYCSNKLCHLFSRPFTVDEDGSCVKHNCIHQLGRGASFSSARAI